MDRKEAAIQILEKLSWDAWTVAGTPVRGAAGVLGGTASMLGANKRRALQLAGAGGTAYLSQGLDRVVGAAHSGLTTHGYKSLAGNLGGTVAGNAISDAVGANPLTRVGINMLARKGGRVLAREAGRYAQGNY
jgi:hypothetical protein